MLLRAKPYLTLKGIEVERLIPNKSKRGPGLRKRTKRKSLSEQKIQLRIVIAREGLSLVRTH